MDRNVYIYLVILALVLAGLDTKATAVYSVGDTAVMPTSSSSKRLEDGVAPELGLVTAVDLDVHSRVFGGIGTGTLDSNKPQCIRNCPAPAGYPYTGRGCKKYYQCTE